MRTKFQAPSAPDYHEQIFIEKMEQYKSINKDTLLLFIFGSKNDRHRQIRKMIEKYHSFKFLNNDGTPIIPLGRIKSINGKYVLVRHDHNLADKISTEIDLNLVTAAIDKKNKDRTYGNRQAKNQISIYDIQKMTLNELMQLAEKMQTKLEE
jgi:glucose-6-phosphate isomerase